MKRLIALFLACLLLCGCGTVPPEEQTQPSESYPAVNPTEPGGSYDPESAIEERTGGAVRAYPLAITNVYGMACMGEDVVIFSGRESTTLTKLSGENLYVTASAQVGFLIYPEDTSVQVTEKGIVYFSETEGELVQLDTNLKEVARIPVPEDLVGAPVLSTDRKELYYCTENALRVLTLETGISRILKEIAYPIQSVEKVLLNGTVVQCRLSDGTGEDRTVFLSAETGQTLWEGLDNIRVTGSGDTWYAALPEGIMQAYVYGQPDGEKRMLVPADFMAGGWYLEKRNCLVAVSMMDDPVGAELNCYDLETGLRISSVMLENSGCPLYMDVNGATGEICVLSEDAAQNCLVLYRWDPAKLPAGDETVYSGPHYTLSSPDTEGLAACLTYARELGERYGVQILFGQEAAAVEPWDYDLTAEYQVPVLLRELERLEQLLAAYPEGMLTDAAAGTPDGILRLCIVREIMGSAESGRLEAAGGACFWSGENVYVALSVGQDLESTLYHEMYHVLETRLLSSSDACYDWDDLNPDGFAYDYNYTDFLTREETVYLDDDDRWFIDAYSMSFPKEDRARIMEYAMIEGNEQYFRSEAMQAKLKALCVGLREAFGMKKSPETYLWEQYLAESLAYGN